MSKAIEKVTNNSATQKIFADFKESLNDPELLTKALRETIFKARFELHLDLYCLPKGKENPNYDYILLYKLRNTGKIEEKIKKEEARVILGNVMASMHLPIKIGYKDFKKDGETYSGITIMLLEKPKEEWIPPKKEG